MTYEIGGGYYRKKVTIHRNSNYMEFIAAHDTNATKAGCIYEAWKDNRGWHIYDAMTGKNYLCPIATLRIVIDEIRTQAEVKLPQEWSVSCR